MLNATLEENLGLLDDLMNRYRMFSGIYDYNGNNLVGIAAKKGNHKLVQLLCSRGMDCNN